MFTGFTDKSRRVMELADQESRRLNRDGIDSVCILYALIRDASGVAAFVLRNNGVDLSTITDLEQRPQSPDSTSAATVIEHAIDEAKNLQHGYVGTEHLLLGILKRANSQAATFLTSQGLTLETARTEIIETFREMARLAASRAGHDPHTDTGVPPA